MSRERLVLAFGGGKGGVGKSLVCSAVATAIARRGRSVVALDADLGAANLHTLLGLVHPSATLDDFLSGRVPRLDAVCLPTDIDGLTVISGAAAILRAANPRRRDRERLMAAFFELDADVLMIDLGAGTQENTLDLFNLAGEGLIVTGTEPTAIQNAYAFIKAALFRALLLEFRGEPDASALVERAVLARGPERIESVERLLTVLNESSPAWAERAAARISGMHLRLVVNQATPRDARRVLGAVGVVCQRYLGLHLPLLGALPADATVVQAVHRMAPVLLEDPDGPFALSVDALVETLLTDARLTRVDDALEQWAAEPATVAEPSRPSRPAALETLGDALRAAGVARMPAPEPGQAVLAALPVLEPAPVPASEPEPAARPAPETEPPRPPEPEAAAVAGPEPDALLEPASESAAEPEPVAEPDPEPDALLEPEPDALLEPASESAAEPEPVAELEPEPDALLEPEPDALPDPEPDALPDPEPDALPDPEPDALLEPEPDALPAPEPDALPAPEPDALLVPEPAPSPEPEPAAELEPEVLPEPHPDALPQAEPDAMLVPEPPAEQEIAAQPEPTVEWAALFAPEPEPDAPLVPVPPAEPAAESESDPGPQSERVDPLRDLEVARMDEDDRPLGDAEPAVFDGWTEVPGVPDLLQALADTSSATGEPEKEPRSEDFAGTGDGLDARGSLDDELPRPAVDDPPDLEAGLSELLDVAAEVDELPVAEPLDAATTRFRGSRSESTGEAVETVQAFEGPAPIPDASLPFALDESEDWALGEASSAPLFVPEAFSETLDGPANDALAASADHDDERTAWSLELPAAPEGQALGQRPTGSVDGSLRAAGFPPLPDLEETGGSPTGAVSAAPPAPAADPGDWLAGFSLDTLDPDPEPEPVRVASSLGASTREPTAPWDADTHLDESPWPKTEDAPDRNLLSSLPAQEFETVRIPARDVQAFFGGAEPEQAKGHAGLIEPPGSDAPAAPVVESGDVDAAEADEDEWSGWGALADELHGAAESGELDSAVVPVEAPPLVAPVVQDAPAEVPSWTPPRPAATVGPRLDWPDDPVHTAELPTEVATLPTLPARAPVPVMRPTLPALPRVRTAGSGAAGSRSQPVLPGLTPGLAAALAREVGAESAPVAEPTWGDDDDPWGSAELASDVREPATLGPGDMRNDRTRLGLGFDQAVGSPDGWVQVVTSDLAPVRAAVRQVVLQGGRTIHSIESTYAETSPAAIAQRVERAHADLVARLERGGLAAVRSAES
jgi:MinD-like ATPase involved in chromosome partitioning or flagellar assembly